MLVFLTLAGEDVLGEEALRQSVSRDISGNPGLRRNSRALRNLPGIVPGAWHNIVLPPGPERLGKNIIIVIETFLPWLLIAASLNTGYIFIFLILCQP